VPKNVVAWEFLIWSRGRNSSAGTGTEVLSQPVLEMETFLASRQSTRNRQSWWERKQVGSGFKTRLVVELAARRFWFRFETLLPCLMMCISIRGLEYGHLWVSYSQRGFYLRRKHRVVSFSIYQTAYIPIWSRTLLMSFIKKASYSWSKITQKP
jgi:hypothetical protein